jgi:hypothetical protein
VEVSVRLRPARPSQLRRFILFPRTVGLVVNRSPASSAQFNKNEWNYPFS